MQKIFSIETYLGPLLMRYIGKYVKLCDDQFQLSLWGGDAVLNYVELQYDIFEDLMPLPVGFKSGHVHELRIQVPWTRLGSSSIVITLNTVECVLAFKRPGEQRQRRRSEADASTPSDTPQPPSYLLSYLTRIWSNIEVVIKNLIVKFVEGDAVISLNIRSLDCFPTLLNWQRGVMAQSAGNYCLHRLLKLTDMTLCIDRCDAKGHISTYQDPVIYRSSFDIRLQTVFTQNNNGLASICVANLFSPRSVEVNLNQVQVPLVARILEILVALSNNIIRWEVLSDDKSIEKTQTGGQHKEVLVGSNEEDLAPNQSWSQWAWSFVPSFPSFSSTPSEDDIYDFDQDDTSLEYIGKLRSCEARAEYVRLLYEDGLASTKEIAKTAQYRRGCLYRLRNHKKPLPALVLGVLMKKIRFHIKAAHRTCGLESTQNKASTTKNLRPNEFTFNLFTIFMENVGFQFVRDSEYFTSLQVGVGLLQISPFGELYDLLALHSKSELLTGSESSDPLIKAFCGLFGVETTHLSDVVEASISDNRYDSNRGVIDAQPSLPTSFVLPPFCRKDYHSTYGSDYPQNKLPLALWFDSVFCREVEEESIEDNSDCLLDSDPTLYSFGRLFLDEVKVNFTLTTSHRLQHFLELLAEGSKNYKACSDWTSLYVLPRQEPVDSWILQETMVRLRNFTPINVKRVQLVSLFVEIFPPTHDHHVANSFASLKLETGSIDAFVSAPLNPVQLVFTMTHLYPSSGVLVDVKSSFHQSLLHDNTLDCKQWGRKEQISDCYGIYQSTDEQQEDDVKKGGVLFGLDDENPITKPLQIDLLNSCYTHQLVKISKMCISLGQEVLFSPVSITLAQRNLLFSKSWPQHLSNDLVTTESYVKFHSQIQLNLSSFAVRSLFIHGFYIVSHGCALSTALSQYLHSQVWSEVGEYSGQLSEDGFSSFFYQTTKGEMSYCLTFSANGFVCLHVQSSKNQNVANLSFETSKLTGKLTDVTNDKIIPILECVSSGPSAVFLYQLRRKISPDSDSLHPASVTLKVAPLKILISSSLIEWFIGVIGVLKTSWKAFDVDQTEKFPLDVRLCSKSQGSPSFHQMDVHTHSPSQMKSLPETISTHSRPHASEGSTFVLVSNHTKLQNCSNSLSSPFSEWIIANYKWLTACKLDISILASTLYIVPTTDLLSTCGFDSWLTSLDATSRGKDVPPPAPISTTEVTGGIRLYGFELEEKQALETQQRFRHLQSVPEMEAMDQDPNHSTWKCTATGIAILIGEATRLLQVGDLACTLSFTITTSQPNNTPSRISWNLLFDISDSTKNTSGDSPRLRDIIHFMAAISRIQKQISNLISEIYATKDLVASHIRKSKDVDSLSNATTPVEVAPCGMEPFNSTKKSLSMVSRVTYSSSHSVAESRNADVHRTSLNIPCTASRIPLKGTIQVTLPNTTGELCLNDEHSKILWEADDFSSTISISDQPFCINFRLQLERICLFLQTSERCFPLISPKHWHIRPFQNVTFCPGTAYHEELKADQRRPKPQEPQGVDSDNEVDVTLSRHLQPTALLTVSLTRSSAVPVRRVFAGKQFSHWLDRQSELFLQGEDRMKVDDVGPPFVNCVYIKLKPLDVVLCPQLVLHLKGALRDIQDSEKIVSTDDKKFFSVEAPLPGHCMPLLFMALDELRLFIPSPGLLFPTYGVIGLCDALAITLRAIRIHPFPTNCITSRPEAASSHARAIILTSKIGSSHEDRQFALRLEGLACWAVSFLEALNYAESARRFDYQPTLAGQYPAFEWNQAATLLNDTKDALWVLPVLRPLDITAVFAAPVCETNLTCGQARLLCSSILEVNISNDIIVTLNGSFLSTYLSNLMSVSERPREQANETAEVNQVTWPFQPSRFLLTCGLLRFVLWERRKCTEPQWDFSVIELIQPHLWWSPEALNAGLNDLQVHLRTFSEGSESDWRNSVFWTPTKPQAEGQTYLPTRLPLPRVTEVGQSQIFNPVSSMEKVCFSSSGNDELLLINFSRQNPKEERFQATIHIQRATTLAFTPNMLMCLSNLRKSFSLRISPIERAKHASDPKALITAFITIFGQLNFGTHSISLHLISAEDEIQFVTEGIQMAGVANQKSDWRSFCANLKVMCINAHMNDFQLIPTATEISLRLCTEVSLVSIPTTVVHIEISRGTKIVIPFGNEFKRLVEAFVVATRQESYGALNAKERTLQHLPSRHVFKDDFSIFVPTEPKGVGDVSQWLPLPYEVIFAECDQFILRDGTESRCVTMTWTFPELRQPVRLTVNPIPFVYDNDAGDLGIVMLPARLQYWSAYVGEYGSFVTYATFNLLEDAPVDVPLPPILAEFPHCSETLAQAQRQQLIRGSSLGERDVLWGPRAALNPTAPLPVAATTWRIIVSCVGRTIPMRDSASAECESVAIPVFLSPYALAACTHLDSAYIPELTTPVSLHVRLDDFCLSTWQACRPIKKMPGPSLEIGRLTVLKLHGLLATSFKNPCNQAPAITSAVDQSITHADSTLLASFSAGSVAIHVFSPHGAHMQLLGEAKRIFGVSGACISVGACHLYCNSDLVHTLSRVTTGEGKTGWEIYNRTDRRILVEQYFTSASPTDEPAASALSSITSVVVEAGGCSSSWRPIILAKTQTITLRIALSAGPHTNSTLAQPIWWDDPGSQDDSFPSAILLIPPRPSSGPPGEASIAVDNTPVFGSSLLLPWRKLSGRLDVVVQPWLLISNRSGISLQLFTASSLNDINLPDESAVKLDSDSCHIPAAGERLFRFGIKFKGDTVWSPALLVHSSVFSSSTTTTSETVTLTVSGVSRAQQQRSRGRTAAVEAVVSLTRSRTLAPLALRLDCVVCCLAARLHSAPPRGVVTLSIEPLLRVDNRTGLPLLCKPIVTPTPHAHLPLPVASLDELGAEVLALPRSGGTLTPILFWNHSHPEVVFEDVDQHGVSFAHLIVLRNHSSIFWSRSLQLAGVYSFDGVCSRSVTEPNHRYYHISLPSFNENGDSDECSLLLNLYNDLQTGLWTLYLDKFAPSLSCPLGCTLTNTTDFPFEASFHSLSDFHQLPVSNALPCVQPSGGRLVLIPQISLDHLAGVWVSGVTPESSASSAFLCHEDVHLFLRLHSDDAVIKLADCRHNPIQLRFGDKTVLIQQVADEALPFCTHLAIFTDQKPVFSHWSHVDQPLSLTVFIDTTLIFASICGSILTPSESGLKDFLRICIRRIEATYLKKENASLFEFSITSSLVQVDNLAQISRSTFDFPVLIRSVLPHTMEENSTGVSSCTFQIRYLSSTDFIIDGFGLCLPSVEAYIEDSVLYALASWVQDLRGALPDWVGEVENAVKSPTSTMLCFRKFEIHPVLLQLALKVKVGMHISCKTTQFRLNKFECSEAALDMKTLFSRLSAHYISQVLIRAGLVLGSLELIGNPACLVASFAEGVRDLVHFADSEKMATREQLSPLRGLARGLMSLVKHTTGGMCSSLTGLASSVARNLHELSLDAEHIQRTTEIRQHHQPAGLGEGLALGISEFGISLLGGLAGVAHHPLFALLQPQPPSPPSSSESPPHHLIRVAEGFAGGVGRGLVGLLAKPLAGVADFVAFTGAGFMHGMGTGWGITPSPIHMCCLTNLTDVSHLVDGALLHKWSCALMRCLNIPHPHEYLWTGVGVDATRTVLTWLCLPCRGSLFTIEFEALVQTVRAGVLAVDFDDTNEDVPIDRYQLPAGEKIVLMRILRCTKNTRTAVKFDDVSGDLEASPHLERVRAYLSSLPHSEVKAIPNTSVNLSD
ncbi:unnamed protein product [Taenia asiatica]|uniref:Chorein_N domain-containing protein n=1 Tax=Taenia asiatica TaxID=60517 RepID=A0A0R3W790_TAEAS|nr:unnamed protein product [Taenia asiatica]